MVEKTIQNTRVKRNVIAYAFCLFAGLIVLVCCFSRPALALQMQDGQQVLPTTIAESIPDDAVLVSVDYAMLPTGELVTVADGNVVTDPEIIGTSDTAPDPLAKTKGLSFVPIDIATARQEIASDSGIQTLSITGNTYGAYWGTSENEKAFFMKDGTRFAVQAKAVIDVSTWQRTINWDAARADGVEGAIIRIGYGDQWIDDQAIRNISECRRLGIPFGIYLYSYATNEAQARQEGAWTIQCLRSAGVSPADLSYPVYYDLESWSRNGASSPSDTGTYEAITRAWVSALNGAGYGNVGVYSYRSYLYSTLNSGYIHGLTSWVAEYGPQMKFTNYGSNARGWQYTSTGQVSGIDGSVDCNAFGNATKVVTDHDGVNLSSLGTQATDIEEGDYFIKSALADLYLDVDNASTSDGADVLTWSATDSSNQLFHITPVGNGEYTIRSVNSGKLLDVYDGSYKNGARIIQWSENGGANQRWRFYRDGRGRLMIASVSAADHNKVLDVCNSSTSLATRMNLWAANGGDNQCFQLMQSVGIEAASAYQISNTSGSLALGPAGDSAASNTSMTSQSLASVSSQQFVFTYKGNGSYTIRNRNSGCFLDLAYGSSDNGTAIVQFVANNNDNQKWYLQKQGSGYRILNYMGNTSITRTQEAAGAEVRGYLNNGASSQQWTLTNLGKPNEGWRVDDSGREVWYENGTVSSKANVQVYDDQTSSWYWVESGAAKVCNQIIWVPELQAWCYYGPDGKRVHGEAFVSYDAEHTGWYYFDQNTGAMAHGTHLVTDGSGASKWVYYDAGTGIMAHGEAFLSYDAEHTGWYYFNDITGEMIHGTYLVTDGSGASKWVYYDAGTGIMAHGEAFLSYDADHTGWYYFNDFTGEMVHGDVLIPALSKWVRYDLITGQMRKGLHNQDGSWYYFDTVTGAMAHGNTWVPDWNSSHWFDEITGRG